MDMFGDEVVSRFLKYVSFDTKSDPNSDSCPSSKSQIKLADFLADECKKIGLSNVIRDDNGYFYACLPSNNKNYKNKIGFMAHMDTSPDFNGKNVSPRIIKNYDGGNIVLNKEKIMSPQEFNVLKNYVSQDLIVTDGTSLLGADDKAGIAEIMTAINYLVKNNIEHGDIKIAFTPDEEIGRGVDKINLDNFDCDYAFTIDGGEIGELSYENFNAAKAKIIFYGKNIHPGEAKNIMVNSILIANEMINRFPKNETPATTEKKQGFYHVSYISGSVEKTELEYIIRDFDKKNFEARKNFIKKLVLDIKNEFGCEIDLKITDQYYNMRDKINNDLIEFMRKAFEKANIIPIEKSMRGGTDGAMLSYKNIPCPNIFTGGHNFHGPYEFVCIQSMCKAVEVIINLASQN